MKKGRVLVTSAIVLFIAAIIAPFAIWKALTGSNEKIETAALVERMNDLNELTTAEAYTKVLIERTNNKIFGQETSIAIPGTEQKVLVVVPGTVRAGVDLSELTEKQVRVDEAQKTLEITLPKPAILGTPSLALDKVKVFSSEGIFRDEATIKEGYDLANQAQKEMLKEVEAEGLLTKAQDNAEESLKNMFGLVNYKVEVKFEE